MSAAVLVRGEGREAKRRRIGAETVLVAGCRREEGGEVSIATLRGEEGWGPDSEDGKG